MRISLSDRALQLLDLDLSNYEHIPDGRTNRFVVPTEFARELLELLETSDLFQSEASNPDVVVIRRAAKRLRDDITMHGRGHIIANGRRRAAKPGQLTGRKLT